MTRSEATIVFLKNVPNRRPIRAAKKNDLWYIYSENILNGGKKIDSVIDNCFYIVDGNQVAPVSMMKLPNDLKFLDL